MHGPYCLSKNVKSTGATFCFCFLLLARVSRDPNGSIKAGKGKVCCVCVCVLCVCVFVCVCVLTACLSVCPCSCVGIETGSGHPSHVLSWSSRSYMVHKISGFDPDSALDYKH